MGSAIFLRTDTTTKGSWVGVYGSEGYNVCGYGTPSYPSYVIVTPISTTPYTNSASSADVRGLQKYDNPSDRFIGGWYNTVSYSVDLTLLGDHQLAVYFNDFDNGNRSERIDVLDGDSGVVLDTRSLALPTGFWNPPVWLLYRVRGHVRLVVSSLNA